MRPTKANLECADLILRRHRLNPTAWHELRRDIAIALTLAEKDAKQPKEPHHARDND